MSAPSDPIGRDDFRALRELVSGRLQGIDAAVRDRLVAGGWAIEDAGVYFLTDRARDFMRTMPEEKVPNFYRAIATLLFTLCGCNLVGAPFEAETVGSGDAAVFVPLDAAGEVLEDGGGLEADGDAGAPLDASRRHDAGRDAGEGLDARDELSVDAPVETSAGDAPIDAVDELAVDAALDGPPDAFDAGEACEAGTVEHENGVGNRFCASEPLGTFDVQLVRAACLAFATATPSAVCSGPPTGECAGASTATVSTPTLALCLTWSSGHVHDAGAGACACPGPSDAEWR